MTLKYKVGTEVIMSPVGISTYNLQSGGTVGVITRVFGCYTIAWENGYSSGYEDKHVLPIPKIALGYLVKTECHDMCIFQGGDRCIGFGESGTRVVTSVDPINLSSGRIRVVRSTFVNTNMRKRRIPTDARHACPYGLCKVLRTVDKVQLGLFEEFPLAPKVARVGKLAEPVVARRVCHHCKGPIQATQSAYTAILRSGERVLFFDRTTAVNWFRDNDAPWLSGGHAAITQE